MAVLFLAEKFVSGIFSSDDVSLLAEELLTRAHESSSKANVEVPNIFFLLIELEWDIRNKPTRAIQTLQKLQRMYNVSGGCRDRA